MHSLKPVKSKYVEKKYEVDDRVRYTWFGVYCGQMLEAYRREKADRLLLLGDLLYHGPRNDLPKGYAPKEVIRMLNEVKEELLCVRGNCEADVDQMVLEFPVMADYCVLQLEDTGVVFASHDMCTILSVCLR
mgnify:CR=1 FL=1